MSEAVVDTPAAAVEVAKAAAVATGEVAAAVAVTSEPLSAPVQVTVSQPEVPDTVNLTAKTETPPGIVVVATAAVNAVIPEDVKLTVSTENKPPPSQPTVTNQPSGIGGTGNQSAPDSGQSFRPQTDDFYKTIFYFSGMGRVIGSALAEGVYVDERNRKSAIDPEEINLRIGGGGTQDGRNAAAADSELITTARNQAVNLSSDFRRLQTLLESLPTFTDATELRSSAGGVRIDEPIHGEVYFRSERPEQYQQQQLASQRMRHGYIIDPSPISSSIHQQQTTHLINVPWNYHNGY